MTRSDIVALIRFLTGMYDYVLYRMRIALKPGWSQAKSALQRSFQRMLDKAALWKRAAPGE